MTEYDEDGNEIETEPEDEPTPLVKQLRKQLAAKSREAARAQRELAFHQSGIRLTREDGTPDPVAGLFVKAYDGDLTAEAIRKEASSYGLAEPIVRTPEITEAEIEAHRRIQGTSTESSAPAGVTYEDFAQMSRPDQITFLASHPTAQKSWEQGKVVPA